MEFQVHGREAIESGIVVQTTYVVISIRDPDKRPVCVRHPPGRCAVLELKFHDAEPVKGFHLPEQIQLMTASDATDIWSFVQEHKDQVGTIVCHCEQGMSRSPAVALALAEALDGDADAIRAESQPNQFVYQLLKNAIEN